VGRTSDALRKLARASLVAEEFAGDGDADFSATAEPYRRKLLAHCYRMTDYIVAFEAYDIDRLAELFTREAIWEMPPFVGWYQGPQVIAALIHQHCPAQAPGDMRLIPLTANGQPAAAMYMRDGEKHLPFQLHVLDMRADGVSHVVAFLDTTLFAKFGLPAHL
jgi:RNA polymerase sigma-70 factor, ECF subfamily